MEREGEMSNGRGSDSPTCKMREIKGEKMRDKKNGKVTEGKS